MALESDLKLPRVKFSEDAIPDGSKELNKQLIEVMDGIPKWYEVLLPDQSSHLDADVRNSGRSREISSDEMEQRNSTAAPSNPRERRQ